MTFRPALSPLAASHRLAQRLGGDRSGVAALEFALILPVLVVLLAGLVDGSRMIRQSMQVKAAAQAGVDFARAHADQPAAIKLAAETATSLAVTAVVDPFAGCVSGQTITAVQAATCPAGGATGQFVKVATETAFVTLLPWPGGVAPSRLQAQAIVRVR